jgi:DNA-binding transcriptional LysR family regulator
MQIRQLECFRVLMIATTMTRAAEILGISQPAVSGTIAALEHDLGFSLFRRTRGRLQPTPEAQLFFVEATRMLEAVESTNRAAAEIRSGKLGHLTIAAYPSISISLLPRIVSLFLATRPHLHIRLMSRSSQTVKELVATQQLDLAIAELPVDHPAVYTESFSYRCQCILPSGHPLAELDVITPADLDGVPFVTLFRDHMTHHQVATAFSQYGARWNVVAETEYFATVCELVAAGCGVGVIDPVVSSPFTTGIVSRKFEPAITYEIGILYPQDRIESRVTKEFVEMLKVHLASD